MRRLLSAVLVLGLLGAGPRATPAAAFDVTCWYCVNTYNSESGWWHDDAVMFFNFYHAGPYEYHAGSGPLSCGSAHTGYEAQ